MAAGLTVGWPGQAVAAAEAGREGEVVPAATREAAPEAAAAGLMAAACRDGGSTSGPLLELADDTGGRAEIVRGLHYTPGDELPGGDRLKQAVESIAMTLRHRYLLGYEPPDGKRGWHEIKVEVTRPDTTARSRKGDHAGG